MPGGVRSPDPVGLVEAGLLETMRRYLGAGRIVTVTATVALGVATVGSEQRPVAVGAGAVALLCAVVGALMLARCGLHSAATALTPVLATGIAQPWVGPPGGNGWAFAAAAITAICAQYEFAARPALAWGISIWSVAACVGGASVGINGDRTALVSTGVRMLLEITLSAGAVLLLRRWARTADRSHERAAEQRRAARLSAARRADEREYLTTLHDTASTTLLMVSLGVDVAQAEWLPQRATDDLRRLSTPPAADNDEVDLMPLLRLAAEHPDVEIVVRGAGRIVVPTPVGLAVFHGMREAVQNVASHAGTRVAVLEAHEEAAGFCVELIDHGRGFDPAQVGDHHRGVAASVLGRMDAAGGRAQVVSAPAAGTRVRWSWRG